MLKEELHDDSYAPVGSAQSLSETWEHLPSLGSAGIKVKGGCINCGTSSTPLWRRGMNSEVNCNACGLYWKLHGKRRPVKKFVAPGISAVCAIEKRKCSNCGTNSTPIWRLRMNGEADCNACGLYWKLHGRPRPRSMRSQSISRPKSLSPEYGHDISPAKLSSLDSIPHVEATLITTEQRSAARKHFSKTLAYEDLPGKIHVTHVEQYPFLATPNANFTKGRTPSGQDVVLKILRPDYSDETGPKIKTKETLEEASIWSALQEHPGVLPLLGLYQPPGREGIAMMSPYMPNGTLREYTKSHPEADKLGLLAEVADVLEFMHGGPVPIIHGDIKGANVVVDNDGRSRVIDFGLAYILNSSEFTSAKTAGTCRWMAPEVMNPNTTDMHPITTAADVYSFAMTILEILTGEIPFSHLSTDGAVVLEVLVFLRYPPRPSHSDAPLLTDELWGLLEKCWDQNPTQRPSIGDIHAFLESSRR